MRAHAMRQVKGGGGLPIAWRRAELAATCGQTGVGNRWWAVGRETNRIASGGPTPCAPSRRTPPSPPPPALRAAPSPGPAARPLPAWGERLSWNSSPFVHSSCTSWVHFPWPRLAQDGFGFRPEVSPSDCTGLGKWWNWPTLSRDLSDHGGVGLGSETTSDRHRKLPIPSYKGGERMRAG